MRNPSTGKVFWNDSCEDAMKAISFALNCIDDESEKISFLEDWNLGDVEEWPEFFRYVGDSA